MDLDLKMVSTSQKRPTCIGPALLDGAV
jgi:hypothetical protein